MFSTKIITHNGLDDMIKDLQATKPLFRAIGKSIVRTTKRNARKHSKGGQFWDEIADSISYIYDSGSNKYNNNSLIVGSTHYAAAHKQFGGTISAPGQGAGSRHAKALTIPISGMSKGKSVRDFQGQGLFKLKSKKGNTILAIPSGLFRFIPLFVLVKSVKQKAYPFFPEGEKLNKAINTGINSYVRNKR